MQQATAKQAVLKMILLAGCFILLLLIRIICNHGCSRNIYRGCNDEDSSIGYKHKYSSKVVQSKVNFSTLTKLVIREVNRIAP